MYLVIAAFIGYYMKSCLNIAQEISNKELALKDQQNNLYIDLPLYTLQNDFKTYGEYIWGIVVNLIQIIFLVLLMAIIYSNELIDLKKNELK